MAQLFMLNGTLLKVKTSSFKVKNTLFIKEAHQHKNMMSLS